MVTFSSDQLWILGNFTRQRIRLRKGLQYDFYQLVTTFLFQRVIVVYKLFVDYNIIKFIRGYKIKQVTIPLFQ